MFLVEPVPKRSFFERPDVIAIVIFDAISNLLFFVFPNIELFYLNDTNNLVGFTLACLYIVFQDDAQNQKIRFLFTTAVVGSVVTALSLTTTYFLILRSVGYTVASIEELALKWVVFTIITTVIVAAISSLFLVLRTRRSQKKFRAT